MPLPGILWGHCFSAAPAAVPGSRFFAEPVNHLIRLHFARGEGSLQEAIGRMKRLKAFL